MYEKLLYDGRDFVALAAVSDDLYNRTVTINGLSKSVAMTGWRMGYLAAPDKTIAKAVNKLQGQCTSNINSITQKASIPALDGRADADVEAMRKVFEERRNIAVAMINAIPGLSVVSPGGAFYLFVRCSEVEPDSMKFCMELLDKTGVATVPGAGFMCEGFFRMSFATDTETIRKGIEKIGEFVQGYQR